jgi:hypothetical protein
MKFTDGSNWLKGRVNPMNPTTDKSTDGLAPGVFFTTLTKYATVAVASAQETQSKLKYECRLGPSIAEVVESIRDSAGTDGLDPQDKKFLVLFGYSDSGSPLPVNKSDFQDIALVVEVPTEDEGPDQPARDAYIPLPMLFIGNSRFRDSVASASYSSSSSWFHHTVYYQPSPRGGFLRGEIETKPMVTLTLTFPKPDNRAEIFPVFKRFTGINKSLDWYHVDVEGEVDWNGGMCGVGHGLLEQLMKPTLKSKDALVINVWGGGNVTEIALVRHSTYCLQGPSDISRSSSSVSCQPTYLVINFTSLGAEEWCELPSCHLGLIPFFFFFIW